MGPFLKNSFKVGLRLTDGSIYNSPKLINIPIEYLSQFMKASHSSSFRIKEINAQVLAKVQESPKQVVGKVYEAKKILAPEPINRRGRPRRST